MITAEKKLNLELGKLIAEFFYCPGSAGGGLPRLLLSQHPGILFEVKNGYITKNKI